MLALVCLRQIHLSVLWRQIVWACLPLSWPLTRVRGLGRCLVPLKPQTALSGHAKPNRAHSQILDVRWVIRTGAVAS
jgi:hypothetical protein